MENPVKQLISELKKDKELMVVNYNRKEKMLMLGINPHSLGKNAFDDRVDEYVNTKINAVGSQIANKQKLKFVTKLVSSEDFMYSFEAKFINAGPLMDIADDIWGMENPQIIN
jgi:hypothetical protein